MPESESTQQQPAGASQEQQKTDPPAETDWKAEARKWEQRAKEHKKALDDAAPKVAQFDALTEASKSELERVQQQATEFQTQATEAERRALIAEVALEKGLPAALARRLQGSTRDELEADATELLAQFPQQSSEPRSPRVDPSQGSSSRGGGAKTPAEEFAALIQTATGR